MVLHATTTGTRSIFIFLYERNLINISAIFGMFASNIDSASLNFMSYQHIPGLQCFGALSSVKRYMK